MASSDYIRDLDELDRILSERARQDVQLARLLDEHELDVKLKCQEELASIQKRRARLNSSVRTTNKKPSNPSGIGSEKLQKIRRIFVDDRELSQRDVELATGINDATSNIGLRKLVHEGYLTRDRVGPRWIYRRRGD